ncbi:DNA-binding protein [Streptomyces sp. SCL15-4]|uniref:DNA-binding protein n=1 Tax=Streptomyces sp. SCL15-4 TaxID=2967221 RepID=UPI00296674D5|nr:DNA-binding protein [Streptomyces sp. SCL15-4]
MPTDKSWYHRPQPPADPDQEYMTVQETAYVLHASTNWIRRLVRANPHLCGRNGVNGKIVTDREQRAEIHLIRSAGDPRQGRSMPRPRRRPTTRSRAAVAA